MFEPSKLFEVVGEPILPLVVKKADPFSLESVTEWLGTMPPDEEYDFNSPSMCLFGQYTTANGGTMRFTHYNIGDHHLNACALQSKIINRLANPHPRTFGAALLRARSFLQAEGGK